MPFSSNGRFAEPDHPYARELIVYDMSTLVCYYKKTLKRTSNSENLLTDDPPLSVDAKILRKHKYEDI